ncbi:MAG TPA: alkaline phosphatase PhoX [Planctomycetota bacterium]|nr:alkaline phosphatase PhoX [Planctomycetota bacterium]
MQTRRDFLKTTAAVTAGFLGLRYWASGNVLADPAAGFGALVPDKGGILDLPAGFSCKVISRRGETMADGLLVPGAPDGMAAFAGADGKTVLIRNHELDFNSVANGAFGAKYALLEKADIAKLYDAGKKTTPGLGGTSTLIFDTKTGTLEKQFMSLAGTSRNCAGGPTPWGSWVTCEETVTLAAGTIEKDHGYNFEVPSTATGLVEAVPLKQMGRMNHEAIAVDPKSGIVYETEDRPDGLIYRYIPNQKEKLAAGGKLQVLKVRDKTSLDTRNWKEATVKVGESLSVEWLDIDEVEAPKDDLRLRGFTKGAARFARGEGMWYGRDAIYFACTNGGSEKLGQIWRYTPSPVEGQADESKQPGKLELFVEPNDGNLVENADNLTVAPWGDLIVCEDGPGGNGLVGVTSKGQVYRFAHNAQSKSELAGVTFSPDGTTLFVNLQGDGMTLAITGPWPKA